MAKLAPPKKASKPTAPKKPTSRSKTGSAACSEAASNWQLSLRGKASLDPDTYRTLAKCRAMNRTAKMAEAQGRTGKLSAMGEQAVKARLQARFDSGLITQKSRTERLDMLLKQRSQRGKAEASKPAQAEAAKPASSFTAISPEEQAIRDRFRQIAKQNPQSPAVTGESKLDAWRRKNAAYERENAAVQVSTVTNSRPGEMIPPKPAQPARYSLGGKLAPGRGTEERKKQAAVMKTARTLAQKAPNQSPTLLGGINPTKTQMTVARARVAKTSKPKYSLGGQLAPGRGTVERKQQAEFMAATRSLDAGRVANVLKKNRPGAHYTFSAKDGTITGMDGPSGRVQTASVEELYMAHRARIRGKLNLPALNKREMKRTSPRKLAR